MNALIKDGIMQFNDNSIVTVIEKSVKKAGGAVLVNMSSNDEVDSLENYSMLMCTSLTAVMTNSFYAADLNIIQRYCFPFMKVLTLDLGGDDNETYFVPLQLSLIERLLRFNSFPALTQIRLTSADDDLLDAFESSFSARSFFNRSLTPPLDVVKPSLKSLQASRSGVRAPLMSFKWTSGTHSEDGFVYPMRQTEVIQPSLGSAWVPVKHVANEGIVMHMTPNLLFRFRNQLFTVFCDLSSNCGALTKRISAVLSLLSLHCRCWSCADTPSSMRLSSSSTTCSSSTTTYHWSSLASGSGVWWM